MIRVLVDKSQDNDIRHVVITGHANYAESGSDIVCAAVSGISLGLTNSVEKLLGIDLDPEINQRSGGLLAWSVPVLDDKNDDNQLQLLMKALVESLLMFEEEYSKYMNVKIETS